MKTTLYILLVLILFSCRNYTKKEININSESYELIVPKNHKELLILFSGFGESNEGIKSASKLIKSVLDENISVLIIKTNRNLFLNKFEKEKNAKLVWEVINENNIQGNEIYIGGFSAGGNLALQLGKYLTFYKNGEFNPKGIFVVDSPVDLIQLYKNCKKKIKKNNSILVNESKFLLNYLNQKIGKPKENLENYKVFSPYLDSLKYIENVKFKKTELVFNTEPALEFNRTIYNRSFEETNSFQLKNLHRELKINGFKTSYIETKNKGYRKNGERNPHSWSIINESEIIEWIKKKTMPNTVYN
ncbi:hypothetical protein [Polaribacter sp. KT 15]|uniref:hypothetical protein n=1 Tax=Polaribacter sp. KT 15 TaxID=1896175 RepID=UPI0009095F73|nr:hypothetical protein [Polaribacter sp. KT 15]SHM83677.1 hypothetical protein SAMN05720268_0868 [Polaribacter sp. KT 15]